MASLAPGPQPDPLAEAAAAFADEDAQAFAPDPLDAAALGFAEEDTQGFGGTPPVTPADIEDAEQGAAMRATIARAQEQQTLQQRYNQNADWRVRIRLAPQANYLYLDPACRSGSDHVLSPLRASDGVIFPYVPTIQTSYQATYDRKDLTHSNYRGYFYRNSGVDQISITGTFTAQDTTEAAYLLAVIHFFRSATKMFYGQDQQRGAPPPLVYLSGFGKFQFNSHPCLISNFNYSLPNTVDYIRVNPINYGQNLVVNRPQTASSPSGTIQSVWNRISSLTNLVTGRSVDPGAGPTELAIWSSGLGGAQENTYVPTKMEIVVTLFPVQTRSQVSQEFSLQKFASGSQLRGGFW